MLINNKDDIEFVTEFLWYFWGHPVVNIILYKDNVYVKHTTQYKKINC